MKTISYTLLTSCALGLLFHLSSGAAVNERQLSVPTSRTSSSKASQQDEKNLKALVETIKGVNIFPNVLATIMAEYAYMFHALKEPITIYQEPGTEAFFNQHNYRFPQKDHHEYRQPDNILRVTEIERSQPDTISGDEFLSAVVLASGLQPDCLTLQEWSHKKDKREERYDEGHAISDGSSYSISDLPQYTFGISIPQEKQRAVSEYIKYKRGVQQQPVSPKRKRATVEYYATATTLSRYVAACKKNSKQSFSHGVSLPPTSVITLAHT